MSIKTDEFRGWFEARDLNELVTWIREGVGNWCRDESLRRGAFGPVVLQPDLPLATQLCNDIRVAAGPCPSRFAVAIDKVLAMWTPYEGPDVFGEYALLAGRMACPGLSSFLSHLTPSTQIFRAAGVHRRRTIISNCAEAVGAHTQFDFPDRGGGPDGDRRGDPRLFEEVRRLRRDFYKTDVPDVQLEWLPREGVRLIDKLAIASPTRIFDAFTAFREDFESYFRDAPETSYRVLQRILRETNAVEIAQALNAAGSDADWMLPYLFDKPTDPTMGEGEALAWPRLLAAEWVSQNGDIEFRYDDGVYLRLLRLGGLYDELALEKVRPQGRIRKGVTGPFKGERLHIFEKLIGPAPTPPQNNERDVVVDMESKRVAMKKNRNPFEG